MYKYYCNSKASKALYLRLLATKVPAKCHMPELTVSSNALYDNWQTLIQTTVRDIEFVKTLGPRYHFGHHSRVMAATQVIGRYVQVNRSHIGVN